MEPATLITLGATSAAAYTDVRTGKVFNKLTYPALVAGCLLHALPLVGSRGLAFALGGVVAGAGVLLIPFLVGELRRVPAVGGGDVKLMAVVGAFLGPRAAFHVLFYTCLVGLVWVVALVAWRVTDTQRDHPPMKLPFAVCIAVGVLWWLLAGHARAHGWPMGLELIA